MPKKNPYRTGAPKKFKNLNRMGEKEAGQEAGQLRDAIEYHNYLYYVKNSPEISDRNFDRLFTRLQEIEDRFPDLKTDDSPTQRVGAKPVDKLKTRRHQAEMQSLKSTLDEGEIKNFFDFMKLRSESGKAEFVLEPKFDGLSVEIVFEKGKFKYGATRGDGVKGEDISHNLKTIGAIPLSLRNKKSAPSLLAVRGEVLMSRKGFQELNKKRVEENREPFANPRNAAAGLVRQHDSKKVVGKPLDIFFYDILKSENGNFDNDRDALKKLSEWGLKTNPLSEIISTERGIRKYYEKMSKKRERIDYEIDGIVIKLNDFEKRKELGTRQRSPRWAMAWKFPPKEEVTVLNDIVVQVGRTGILTPVALLDPVDVGGVTVSRATLHNEENVREKDIRPGDLVRIERAGDVIPEVVERIKKRGRKRGRKFSMPGKCPVCGTKVEREGAYHFCPAGLSCKAQLIGTIQHFSSREALDIENLGEKVAEEMVDKDMIGNIADLYDLSVNDLKKLDGFADRSAKKLHKAIQDSKRPTLARFIYALGIQHVGEHMARVLAGEFGSLDRLKNAGRKKLEKIDEVGGEIAGSVHEFFNRKENRKSLKRLEDAGVKPRPQKTGKSGRQPLTGKTIVFTGELVDYSRDEARELVESLGGRATSSVSGNTDYVVVGEGPGSKLDEAKKRKVKRLDEREFKKLIGK